MSNPTSKTVSVPKEVFDVARERFDDRNAKTPEHDSYLRNMQYAFAEGWRHAQSAHETTADAAALARVTFAKNRYDRCTWILYLLEDEQISVGKAAEWLREYIRDGKEGSLPPQQISNPEADEVELMRRMTAAMREADETFERVGGSTRHHVRDCLLPILGNHGLRLRLTVKTSTGPADGEPV